MDKKKFIKRLLFVLFFIYIVTYIVSMSGYYEYSLQSKKSLTESEIKRFEEDIRNGKYVDIQDYMSDRDVDYTNNLTKATVKYSKIINRYLNNGIEMIFRFLNKLL